ncbi:hypothetical protein SAMN04487996_13718 [Dyadobacter soli]|uniref:Nucleotidyltransferase n=1 Tax=Dyadobacter soli TaxID=659014 RepID=A0A1G8CD11_9BACT|nr:hypothetical protein [Dyadobacter soli]SDH43258.1 hypothetical protein SAMN04487996_13718 [Dyadobacter soli]
MSHTASFKDVLATLIKHEVEYLVVGGVAVGYYGYIRMSVASNGQFVDEPDLDIWFNPTYSNYYLLLDALEAIQIDVARLKAEQAPDPRHSFLRYKLGDCTLDLLPQIKAPIRFRDAFERRRAFIRDSIEIFIISIEDLIADKEASGRPKDLVDIAHLKKMYFPLK